MWRSHNSERRLAVFTSGACIAEARVDFNTSVTLRVAVFLLRFLLVLHEDFVFVAVVDVSSLCLISNTSYASNFAT